MLRFKKLFDQIAPTDYTSSLGETGTGKDLVARRIHVESPGAMRSSR